MHIVLWPFHGTWSRVSITYLVFKAPGDVDFLAVQPGLLVTHPLPFSAAMLDIFHFLEFAEPALI